MTRKARLNDKMNLIREQQRDIVRERQGTHASPTQSNGSAEQLPAPPFSTAVGFRHSKRSALHEKFAAVQVDKQQSPPSQLWIALLHSFVHWPSPADKQGGGAVVVVVVQVHSPSST